MRDKEKLGHLTFYLICFIQYVPGCPVLTIIFKSTSVTKTGAKGENKINAYGFVFFSGKCDSCVYFVGKSEQLNCFLLSPSITERTHLFSCFHSFHAVNFQKRLSYFVVILESSI